jgi:hypothetical protein
MDGWMDGDGVNVGWASGGERGSLSFHLLAGLSGWWTWCLMADGRPSLAVRFGDGRETTG